MTDFEFTELLPLGPDATTYRKLDLDGVSTVEAAGHTFVQVEPRVLTALAGVAKAEVSLEQKQAVVEFDAAKVSRDQLKAVIEDAGFDAS